MPLRERGVLLRSARYSRTRSRRERRSPFASVIRNVNRRNILHPRIGAAPGRNLSNYLIMQPIGVLAGDTSNVTKLQPTHTVSAEMMQPGSCADGASGADFSLAAVIGETNY
jgi:hypothetical protein